MLVTDSRAAGATTAAAPLEKPAATWREVVEQVAPFLDNVSVRLSEQVREFEPEIAAYAEYALKAQGKQLRPLLVALSADAVGELNGQHVNIAAIIEMIHLATLVHDDVMDSAEIRRGRPTLAVNWGNEVSVLLGDCLFAHALKLAASFPTTEVCRAVAVATNTVCSGEILQTLRRGQFSLSRAEYFRMLAMKTATLFSLSCDLGGLGSGADARHREALRRYGVALGIAYQIYDDCLDLFGSERMAGKSLGTDLAGGKLTLPVLIALERAEEGEKQQLQEHIREWKPDFLPSALALLEKYETLSDSRCVIHEYLEGAREALATVPATEGRAGLARLAEYLAQQTDVLGV